MTNPNESLRQIAHDLTAAGISVLPVNTPTDKRPFGRLLPKDENNEPTWTPFQFRIPEQDEINRWFNGGCQGIGRIHGAISGNLETIDFDRPDGYPDTTPRETLDEFAKLLHEERAWLFDRLTQIKTSKGFHLVYRCESAVSGNEKLAFVVQQDTDGKPLLTEKGRLQFKELIETRGEGGYAVTPPSAGYEHISGPDLLNVSVVTSDERELLLATARLLDRRPKKPTATTEVHVVSAGGASDSNWIIRPGDDYNQRESWEPLLAEMQLDFVYEASDGTRYLKRRGSSNPIGASLNHEGKGLLFCWTPNCGVPSETYLVRLWPLIGLV